MKTPREVAVEIVDVMTGFSPMFQAEIIEAAIAADRRALLAEDEATIEAIAKGIYGMRDSYTTDFWRNYIDQACCALAALRRIRGVE